MIKYFYFLFLLIFVGCDKPTNAELRNCSSNQINTLSFEEQITDPNNIIILTSLEKNNIRLYEYTNNQLTLHRSFCSRGIEKAIYHPKKTLFYHVILYKVPIQLLLV
jgi:hypothetical protein